MKPTRKENQETVKDRRRVASSHQQRPSRIFQTSRRWRPGWEVWCMRTAGEMLKPPWRFSSLCPVPSVENPPRRSSCPAGPGCAELLPVGTCLCSSPRAPASVSWHVLQRQRSRFGVQTRSLPSSKRMNNSNNVIRLPLATQWRAAWSSSSQFWGENRRQP